MHITKFLFNMLTVIFLTLPSSEYASEVNKPNAFNVSNLLVDDQVIASAAAQLIAGNACVEVIDLKTGLSALDYAETIKESHPRVYAVIKSREIQKDSLQNLLKLKSLIAKPGISFLKGGKYQQKEKRARILYQQTCEIIAKHLPENN